MGYLIIILIGFILFKNHIYDRNPDFWIKQFYGNPTIIYLIYICSEVFFGIFPPELFMLWALNKGVLSFYIFNMAFFTAVSYGAGHLAFLTGRFLAKKLSTRLTRLKFFTTYLPKVKKFGAPLIIIAALTPVPWSTIALIMGATKFNYQKFTLYALSRIARFAVYGFILYHTHALL